MDSSVLADSVEQPVWSAARQKGTMRGMNFFLPKRSQIAFTVSVTSFLVTLDCYPPMIVGAAGNQPVTQSVQSGKVTTLDVKPSGSGPFTYQWFRGSAGQTNFPVAGATNRTFTTPAQTGTEAYWVRVSNACGSVDSTTATISTAP